MVHGAIPCRRCVRSSSRTALWAQDAGCFLLQAPQGSKSSLPDSGAISQGVYRNPAFDFSYKLPFGWVDRTAEMQDDSAEALESRLLLAIFERPPRSQRRHD